MITWVSKNYWEMLLSELSQAGKIINCTRKIICNNCEQINVSGDILNAGWNVEDEEDYGFTSSFFKIPPTVIDYITKTKMMKMQLGNLIFQRDIENIDKWYDEGNCIDMVYDKEYDERNWISENYEYTFTNDIEVLKLGTLSSKRYI